jgi:hypothetical protein
MRLLKVTFLSQLTLLVNLAFSQAINLNSEPEESKIKIFEDAAEPLVDWIKKFIHANMRIKEDVNTETNKEKICEPVGKSVQNGPRNEEFSESSSSIKSKEEKKLIRSNHVPSFLRNREICSSSNSATQNLKFKETEEKLSSQTYPRCRASEFKLMRLEDLEIKECEKLEISNPITIEKLYQNVFESVIVEEDEHLLYSLEDENNTESNEFSQVIPFEKYNVSASKETKKPEIASKVLIEKMIPEFFKLTISEMQYVSRFKNNKLNRNLLHWKVNPALKQIFQFSSTDIDYVFKHTEPDTLTKRISSVLFKIMRLQGSWKKEVEGYQRITNQNLVSLVAGLVVPSDFEIAKSQFNFPPTYEEFIKEAEKCFDISEDDLLYSYNQSSKPRLYYSRLII